MEDTWKPGPPCRLAHIILIAPDATDEQKRAGHMLVGACHTIAGGVSIYPGRGEWRNPQGETLAESHIRIEVFTDSAVAIVAAHRRFGDMANEHTLARIVDGVPVFESRG